MSSTPYRNAPKFTKLYVGNLSYEVTWKDLKDHFKPCGLVLRADVLEGSDGKSKGCGLVEYADARDAARAVETLNDSELCGRPIFVREDREASASTAPVGRGSFMQGGARGGGPATQGVAGTRLYVGNLAWDVAWQDLKDHFKPCGAVVRADVLEGSDGRSKGCGIIEFADPRDAARAMDTLNDSELKGRMIFVREDRETTGAVAAPGTRLYVGNLAWDVAWQDLKDHFKPCGAVVRADVLEGSDGRSKGCGIIEFADPRDAARAMGTLNDSELKGRMIFVREDREAVGFVATEAGGGIILQDPSTAGSAYSFE